MRARRRPPNPGWRPSNPGWRPSNPLRGKFGRSQRRTRPSNPLSGKFGHARPGVRSVPATREVRALPAANTPAEPAQREVRALAGGGAIRSRYAGSSGAASGEHARRTRSAGSSGAPGWACDPFPLRGKFGRSQRRTSPPNPGWRPPNPLRGTLGRSQRRTRPSNPLSGKFGRSRPGVRSVPATRDFRALPAANKPVEPAQREVRARPGPAGAVSGPTDPNHRPHPRQVSALSRNVAICARLTSSGRQNDEPSPHPCVNPAS